MIVNHLFRIFDRDNSGTIDFSEFVLATDITTSGEPEEKLRWTFRVSSGDKSELLRKHQEKCNGTRRPPDH